VPKIEIQIMNTLGTLWLLGAQYEFNSIPEGTGLPTLRYEKCLEIWGNATESGIG
jgi:hypothetical protein